MAAWLAGYASGGSYWNSVGWKLLYLDAGEREADTERLYCLWAVSCSGTFCGLSLWRGDAGVVSGAEFVTVQPATVQNYPLCKGMEYDIVRKREETEYWQRMPVKRWGTKDGEQEAGKEKKDRECAAQ